MDLHLKDNTAPVTGRFRGGSKAMCLSLAIALACCARAASAESTLQDTGIQGGLVVVVGCGNPKLLTDAGASGSTVVQGLDTDPGRVGTAREHIRSKGVYGKVTARLSDGRTLPYGQDVVNLVVIQDARVKIPAAEIKRVLAPRGVAVGPEGASCIPRPVSRLGGGRVAYTKPVPGDVDDWTHFLYGPDNNAVSRDRQVASPRSLQWVTSRVYGRHHDRLASLSAMVSANGRLFTIEDLGPAHTTKLPADWRLIARDAFNGVTLWQRGIKRWQSPKTRFRSGPTNLPRRLVAVGDRVYAALDYGSELVCLDAATGKTRTTFKGTAGAEEVLHQDGKLYVVAADANEPTRKRVLKLDAASGKTLWETSRPPACNILSASLAVGADRLFFHDGQAVVAINRSDGTVRWRHPVPSVTKRPSWLAPTIVFQDGVVLCADRVVDLPEKWKGNARLVNGVRAHGGPALLTAMSAADGKKLWNAEASECFHGSPDVFVIDGVVWAANGPARYFYEAIRPALTEEMGKEFYIEKVTGRDLRTGKVVKTLDADEAFTLGHHHRCFRNKATERFILIGRTGIGLINLEGGLSLRHTWTRGGCQYGVMPANGLLYAPPHPCACYNAAKLNGFFAYSSRKAAGWSDAIPRLRKGPAFAKATAGKPAHGGNPQSDWPTYRCDNARSGGVRSAVSDRPAVAWSTELGGTLSAPTSADNKVFVCDAQRHTVHALDLGTGKRIWSYLAGGRVDSPPAYEDGRVTFGSADGVIHCLHAGSGTPIWTYLAAPRDACIVSRDQLESPWPVPGTVLVRDGSVFALAGRSSFIDGGMYFVKLDARTGQLQLKRQIYDRDPKTGRQTVDNVDTLYLAGLLYDIPSSVGDSIFIREARLSLAGARIKEDKAHLYSAGGFLDDKWWHRYCMTYGSRVKNGPGGGGFARTGGAPNGRLMVYDDTSAYGYGEMRYGRFRLYRMSKDARRQPRTAAWANTTCPVMVHAMALARAPEAKAAGAARLVIAGPPTRALSNMNALRGAEGSILAVVHADTGKILSQRPIKSAPVFDGMCIARGRVILSLASGSIVALR